MKVLCFIIIAPGLVGSLVGSSVGWLVGWSDACRPVWLVHRISSYSHPSMPLRRLHRAPQLDRVEGGGEEEDEEVVDGWLDELMCRGWWWLGVL